MSEYEFPLGIRIIVIIMLIGMCLLFFLMVGVLIDQFTSKTMGYKMTECYDRFSNEIQGLECEEEIACGIVSRDWFNEEYCKDIDYKTSQKRRKTQ